MRIEQFLSFANCISDPILLVGDDGLILSYNQAAKDVFSLKVDHVGRNIHKLFKQEPAGLKRFILRCLSTDEPILSSEYFESWQNHQFSIEGKILPGTREIMIRCFPYSRSINPLTIKLADEIKRRESIERQLSASQAHFRAILETAADAIITVDENADIVSFNTAAEKIFGYKTGEIIGEHMSLLLADSDQLERNHFIKRYLASYQSPFFNSRRETMARRKNGEHFHIEIGISEVVVDNRRTFTAIIRDVHRRTLAEQQIKAQEEEQRQQRDKLVHVARLSTLGELAAGIAHEINQPLTAIFNYAKVNDRTLNKFWLGPQISDQIAHLKNHPPSLGQLKQLSAANFKISEQARRAGNVIQRLRDLIKKEVSEIEHIDLNQLVKDTMILAETDTRVNNYELVFAQHEKPLWVMADSIQLQQVVLNFVRNAIDAMSEAQCKNGTITLATTIKKGRAELAVCDEGSGIMAVQANQIFDPFYTTKSDGLGLGLSISQNIIQNMGGTIGFENIYQANKIIGARLYFHLKLENKKSKNHLPIEPHNGPKPRDTTQA